MKDFAITMIGLCGALAGVIIEAHKHNDDALIWALCCSFWIFAYLVREIRERITA